MLGMAGNVHTKARAPSPSMSSPTNPVANTASSAPRTAAAAAPAAAPMSTPALLAAMLRTSPKISDLFFSPGKPPLVEVNGKLVPAGAARSLTCEDTRRIASDLMSDNQDAAENLRKLGSCDVSFSLPGSSRFRVNIFMQRGTCAVVMRVIPGKVPDFESLNLPLELGKIVGLRNGIVLVTGPTGSGKSSTLAAIIDKINKEQSYHVLTIEDPIEFLHPHKNCIVHQRELHADTPSFALALRAALRQAPKVILVGEMRDRETIERIVGAFPMAEQHTLRNRLAKSFRYIVSQRLIPRKDATGRVAAFEILKSTLRTREYVEKGEGDGKTLLDAMRVGGQDGMQTFDGEIEKLIREGIVDMDTGLAYSTNPGNLQLELADLAQELSDPLLETSTT